MIQLADISAVPVGRVLHVIGLARHGYWAFGEVFTAPSPHASAKRQRKNPSDLHVTKGGAWSDSFTKRRGTDVVGLAAYMDRTTRDAAAHRLQAALQLGDLVLNRIVHAQGQGNPFVQRSEQPAQGAAVDDTRLAKFAARGTPRQRATALLQVAMNDVARDRRGDR